MSADALAWLGLFGLGAAQELNPALGWLFAVGIGLQERDRRGSTARSIRSPRSRSAIAVVLTLGAAS
jgi:hypothetical protein